MPSNIEGCRILVRSQEADHPVIRQMHAIGTLIYENRDRSIAAGVRNMFDHLFHDQRVSNEEADDPVCVTVRSLTYNFSLIKLSETHQASLTNSLVDDALHLSH